MTTYRHYYILFFVLFALLGIGYFGDIAFLTRGAATMLIGTGIGIFIAATMKARAER